jgi:hypothetical protein
VFNKAVHEIVSVDPKGVQWFSVMFSNVVKIYIFYSTNHVLMFNRYIIRAPPYDGCPIVISLSVRVSVHVLRPSQMKFSGGFSTPFLIGTWNFHEVLLT